MDAKHYDAIVIGGGPGGYTAAIRLAQLGRRTLCIEKESFGGVCLNWGCIPSKALITAAATADRIRHASVMGIEAGEPRVDFAATQRWKAGIVEKLTTNVATLIRSNGGEAILGTARLAGGGAVDVTAPHGTATRYTADAIVLATGARLAQLPGFAPDGERILTARDAVDLPSIPASLLVIGGGVIGLELGMMVQRFGAKLTVVEVADALLPGVDADLTRVVERRIRGRGGEILTAARAEGWDARDGGVAVTVRQGDTTRTIEAEKVLVAVGFAPNTAGLGLADAGVRLDARGFVAVDERMETSVPGVFAVGDLTGGPFLAHRAFRQGEVAAEVIAGRHARADWLALPAAVFTDPEIATVGIGEAEAKRQGIDVIIGRFPFSASGRALSLGETDGFVKVISDRERVIGVQIVGPEASEMIGEAAFALEMMASPEDVALTIHPHPTLTEGFMEAFKHVLGEAVHVMNRKRPHAEPQRTQREVAGAGA